MSANFDNVIRVLLKELERQESFGYTPGLIDYAKALVDAHNQVTPKDMHYTVEELGV